jgi:hypothetical protein
MTLIIPPEQFTPAEPMRGLPIIAKPSMFAPGVIVHEARPGQTIADILRDMPGLPPEVWTHGVVVLEDMDGLRHEIGRAYWHRLKPKPGTLHSMHICTRPQGGGQQGGGKSILSLVASIALLVALSAISGGALAGVLGTTLFAAGSTSAALAAAGIGVLGSLAISALTPPPEAPKEKSGGSAAGTASIQGNVLQPFEPIPFVLGTHRVAPPHMIPPWSEAINDDQYIYAILGLNGPHAVDDILLNATPIDDLEGVEYEIRDVATDDTPLSLIDKQVFEQQVGTEIAGHKVNDDDTDEVQDAVTPSNSYPQWVSARSRNSPHEIWLTFVWAGLIYNSTSGSGPKPGGVCLRIRIRRKGDSSWINLPEFVAIREKQEIFRGMIKLVFSNDPPTGFDRVDEDTSFPPWAYALYVRNADNAEGFNVSDYFEAVTAKHAIHVGSENGIATIYLDPAQFPAGAYDVQVMRGYGFDASDFNATTYRLSTLIPCFFTHVPGSSPPALRVSQSKAPGKISWAAMSSVWNDLPLQGMHGGYGGLGLTLIAIKAKNIAVQSLTALFTGYAPWWNGFNWETKSPTRNAAAWGRAIALGQQSIRPPYIEAQLDDESLQDWYDFCDGASEAAKTDFTGATLGATPTGWTSRWSGNTTANVTADAALPSGRGPLFDRTTSDAHTLWTYDTPGLIANVEALAVVRPLSYGAANFPAISLMLRASGAAASEGGYRFRLSGDAIGASNRIEIGKWVSGTFTQLAIVAFEWSLNNNYYMRVRAEGSALSMKVWLQDDPEPLDWTLTATDSAITAAGRVGAAFLDTAETFTIGSIVVRSIGGAAREANAFVTGSQSVGDIMKLAGSAGHAAWRASDKIGVIVDKDRSAEAATQLFTQRNTRGLTIRRAFPRIPHGFRVRFNDELNDYNPTEIFVYRPGYDGTNATDIEAVTYVGITSEAAAMARAQLDFVSLLRRAKLYDFSADVETLYCIKGSLVALAHDTVSRHHDAARVATVTDNGTNVTALTTDSELRFSLSARSTNFEDETLASPPAGWASQWDANVTALVTAQANLPGLQGPLLDKTTANGDAFFAWTDADADTEANVEVLALIRPNVDSGDTSNAIGVVLRGSGNNSTKTGYRAALNSASAGAKNRIEISKWVGGTFTFLANATFNWLTGVNYWIRFRARGTSLKAKVWADGGAEPASWTVTTTDASVAGPGKSGAYVFNTASTFYVGSFQVSPLNGVVLQLKDGSTMVAEVEETIDTASITFTTPFPIPAGSPDPLDVDCLIACGPFSSTRKRMLVLGVKPNADLSASVTLIDEAEPVITYASDGQETLSSDGQVTWARY